MSGLRIVVGYAFREAVRRRVFVVVVILTVGYLALYALGAARAFDETGGFVAEAEEVGVDTETLTGATLLGLSMFATLFLGVILAVFLTLGAVRGDAERGLLQPLVVRPLGRSTLLLARFVGAVVASSIYVALVFAAGLLITGATGGWWPDRIVVPMLELAGAVAIVTAISLLGSVYLSSTANGIAVFMIVGAGLVAGLLGQVGEAIQSSTLESISTYTTWALPFEALYQDALSAITAETRGVTRVIVELGPFGGAQESGGLLWVWAAAYLSVVGAAAAAGFARRDL